LAGDEKRSTEQFPFHRLKSVSLTHTTSLGRREAKGIWFLDFRRSGLLLDYFVSNSHLRSELSDNFLAMPSQSNND
jgi:hypothetical protein